jgi:hypothetical protein
MDSTGRRILHSWKEISNYTGFGIRTVQRYEMKFSLPVHRPAGKIRSAVLAFADEVDNWVVKTPIRRTDRRASNEIAKQAS